MEETKESIMTSSTEQPEDTKSTDSKESRDSKEGKKDSRWDFKRLRNSKKVPRLFHSFSLPASSTSQVTPTSPVPDKDPLRFFGEGVNFKAKLIGIKDVQQPRGDRLAQDALQELKASVKAISSHKLKITINISVDGIKIKDEKGQEVLHHHPVHKISFIAQDISDARAFGYVFGSPAIGHKFFAIKTEKAAQQVVITMRDLFQVIFEMRKKTQQQALAQEKNSEPAPQPEIQHNPEPEIQKPVIEHVSTENTLIIHEQHAVPNGHADTNSTEPEVEDAIDAANSPADLLNLELEDSSLEKTQMSIEDDFFNSSTDKSSDPFFTDPLNFISSISTSFSPTSVSENPFFTVNTAIPANQKSDNPFENDTFEVELKNGKAVDDTMSDPFNTSFIKIPSSTPNGKEAVAPVIALPPERRNDRYAPLAELSVSGTSSDNAPSSGSSVALNEGFATGGSSDSGSTSRLSSDGDGDSPPPKPPRGNLFSDLDPLGKDRPYVDKKLFFQEVKNPPKKVLKELVEESRRSCSPQSFNSSTVANPPPPSQSLSFNNMSADFLSSNMSNVTCSSTSFNSSVPFGNESTSGRLFSSTPFAVNPDDPFSTDDFNLPSPTTPPPPPPAFFPSPPSVLPENVPVPPPRPIATIPPPLPPKRQQPAVSTLIALAPPPSRKDRNVKDNSINGNESNAHLTNGSTLPIPIPARRNRGAVSIPVANNSSNASHISSSSSSFNSTLNGSVGPSVSPRASPGLPSVTSCMFGDVSSINANSSQNSVNSSAEVLVNGHISPIPPPPVQYSMTNGDSRSSNSVTRNGHSPTSSLNIMNGLHDISKDKANASKSSISNKLDSTQFQSMFNDSFVNNSAFNSSQGMKPSGLGNFSWNNNINNNNCSKISDPGSIFKRETDPFADEFFTSLATSSGTEKAVLLNQNFWTVNPFQMCEVQEHLKNGEVKECLKKVDVQ